MCVFQVVVIITYMIDWCFEISPVELIVDNMSCRASNSTQQYKSYLTEKSEKRKLNMNEI